MPRRTPSSSRRVSRVVWAAARSSRSNSWAVWASAASGSTTWRSPLPRLRSPRASKCAAWPIRCRSACSTRSGSRWSGRSSTARMIIRAWSTSRSPAASAWWTGGWCSRPAASLVLRCASVRVIRVAWAHQFATEVAPTCSATPTVPAWPATRASSSATRAPARVSSVSVAAVSVVSIDHSEASVTWSRRVWRSATARDTWCRGCVCAVIATPEKQFVTAVYRTGVRAVKTPEGKDFAEGSAGEPGGDGDRRPAEVPAGPS